MELHIEGGSEVGDTDSLTRALGESGMRLRLLALVIGDMRDVVVVLIGETSVSRGVFINIFEARAAF